jgi:hypothetical protein
MQTAYINRVETAVPPYDVHDAFRRFRSFQGNSAAANKVFLSGTI